LSQALACDAANEANGSSTHSFELGVLLLHAFFEQHNVEDNRVRN